MFRVVIILMILFLAGCSTIEPTRVLNIANQECIEDIQSAAKSIFIEEGEPKDAADVSGMYLAAFIKNNYISSVYLEMENSKYTFVLSGDNSCKLNLVQKRVCSDLQLTDLFSRTGGGSCTTISNASSAINSRLLNSCNCQRLTINKDDYGPLKKTSVFKSLPVCKGDETANCFRKLEPGECLEVDESLSWKSGRPMFKHVKCKQ